MTGITRTRIAVTVTVIAAGISAAAQAPPVNDAKNFDVGSTVQLQGCVVGGEKAGTYVFSRVTVWPVANSPNGRYGPRHFWLENAGPRLADHVGETVQFTGVIVDMRESEIEREPGISPVGQRVAIELPGGDVFTSPELAGIPAGQAANKEDMKITLLKVRVESQLTVMKGCLPQPG